MANARHLQTNHISPQFHLIHNDNFETILNDTPLDHPLSDQHLLDIFDISHKVYADIEFADNRAIVYAPPSLDDIWLDEGERHKKKLELAKERAQAQDCWRFEAEAPPVPVPTTAPTPVPTMGPCFPNGPVVSNKDSSESSDSHDDDSFVSAAANNSFIAKVQHRQQRPRQDEGATLGGQHQSKRLMRGRNPRPLCPLTGIVLKPSLLTKKPRTHALIRLKTTFSFGHFGHQSSIQAQT